MAQKPMGCPVFVPTAPVPTAPVPRAPQPRSGLSFLERAIYAHFTELNGPHRAALVFTYGGDAVMHSAVLTELPATDEYLRARDLARIWDNYSIGQTIPVVIFQESEMIGYSVMPLPREAGAVSFCGRCGNCDHTEPRCPL